MPGQKLVQGRSGERGQPLTLTSLVARSVSEMAESYRGPNGDPGYLITTYDESTRTWTTTFQPQIAGGEEPVSNDTQVVTPVNTVTVTQRPEVIDISIQADGMLAPVPLMKYDAVFWSESAVEKFLFPYYASKSQWAAAYVLDALSELFYRRKPKPDVSDEEVPFAVAHLPRSTYQGLSEPATLGADLEVLHMHRGTGKVIRRRFSDYLQRRAEAGHGTLTAGPGEGERARPAGGLSPRTAAGTAG